MTSLRKSVLMSQPEMISSTGWGLPFYSLNALRNTAKRYFGIGSHNLSDGNWHVASV